MLRLEEGGASPAPADSALGGAALSARGAGRGPRAPGAAEQTKDAPRAAGAGPSRLLHWAASATLGGDWALGSIPPSRTMGRRAAPGWGNWAGTPATGEGDSNKDVEFSVASAAQENLASALRGLRCHPHFRDGETEAPVEGLNEPAWHLLWAKLCAVQDRASRAPCIGETDGLTHTLPKTRG